MAAYNSLEIPLVETIGPMLRVQLPHLVLWFNAFQAGGAGRRARVLVLDRPQMAGLWKAGVRPPRTAPWTEHVSCVFDDKVDHVLQLLSELGIPSRELRVQGASDSSDTWTRLILYVQLNGQQYALDVDMLLSGFEGEDADQLRRLIRSLLALAGEGISSVCISPSCLMSLAS